MQTITQLCGILRPGRGLSKMIAMGLIAITIVGCDSNKPQDEVRERLEAGDVAGSLELLRELISDDPENAELLYLYGRVLKDAGQPGAAEWPLRKAMEDSDWFRPAAILVASIAMRGRNLDTAISIFEEILEVDPEDIDVRLLRANACAESPRHTEEALAEVDRILEISPDEVRAYKPRVLAYLGLDQPEEAKLVLEELGVRLEELESGDEMRGWHCATMAIFADESGEETLAEERWASCEEEFPAHANVVEKSILFHKDRGELERALEVAERAFEVDSSQRSGYRIVVADLLRLQGRDDDAESLLKEMIGQKASGQNPAHPWLVLANHYQEVGDLVAATDSLENGLAIAEKIYGPQPDLLFLLADLMIQIDRDEEALELTRRMTVAAHRSLVRARVAHKRKRYASALDFYRETMRLWPENTYAPYHAGWVAMQIGDFDLALQNFIGSVRVEGETDARFQAARIMAEEGRWVSALKMLGGGGPSANARLNLYRIELLARYGEEGSGLEAAKELGKRQPRVFGRAVEVATNEWGRSDGAESAWKIVGPLVSRDFPPFVHLPILRSATTWAPGEEELELLEPLVLKAVESEPAGAFPREIEGLYLERTGAAKEAEASYRLALEAEPGRSTTLLRLARLVAEEDPQGAVVLVDRGLTDEFDAELFLAAMSALNDTQGGIGLAERALEIEPTSGRIALVLGELLERQGGPERRILRLANRALRFRVGAEAEALRDRVLPLKEADSQQGSIPQGKRDQKIASSPQFRDTQSAVHDTLIQDFSAILPICVGDTHL